MATHVRITVPWVLWHQLPHGDLQDEDMMKKFGWMYARYRPACYYFEWVLMAQKAAIAFVTIFLSNSERFWISWPVLMIITIVSLVLQLKLLPYIESEVEKIETPVHIELEAIDEMSEEAKSEEADAEAEPNNESWKEGHEGESATVAKPSRTEGGEKVVKVQAWHKKQSSTKSVSVKKWSPTKEASWKRLPCFCKKPQVLVAGLPKNQKPKYRGRPPLTIEEQLLSSPTNWHEVRCSTLCTRWLQVFRYPLSLNSLEVTGLNVQLIVLSTTVYWKLTGVSVAIDCAIYDDQPLKKALAQESGELEGCKPLDNTSYWLGVFAVVLPSCFIALALALVLRIICRGYKDKRKNKKMERQLLEPESPRPKPSLMNRLRTAVTYVRRGVSAVRAFQVEPTPSHSGVCRLYQ